jgi:hypothetical protein
MVVDFATALDAEVTPGESDELGIFLFAATVGSLAFRCRLAGGNIGPESLRAG